MAFSREEMEQIVATGDFDKLKGEPETPWFDAKSQLYVVSTPAGKRDLAKDVAAFANAGGGTILIGLRTEKSSAHFGDVVTEVVLVDQALVNVQQYHDILNAWLYPACDGITIEWIESSTTPGRGLAAIRVPRQADSAKPFLI
jgi:hypothetical protein